MAIASVITKLVPDIRRARVYELSARGPLVGFLRSNSLELVTSEFLDGVAPGTVVSGVQCQNVEALTYADASFDLCTSTDVFEHVADDAAGFRELHRVLRPGGRLVFTVPISLSQTTVERARRGEGGVEYLLEPEYHHDRQRGVGGVLAFRDYGADITERLLAAGFRSACIDRSAEQEFFGFGRAVITAEK